MVSVELKGLDCEAATNAPAISAMLSSGRKSIIRRLHLPQLGLGKGREARRRWWEDKTRRKRWLRTRRWPQYPRLRNIGEKEKFGVKAAGIQEKRRGYGDFGERRFRNELGEDSGNSELGEGSSNCDLGDSNNADPGRGSPPREEGTPAGVGNQGEGSRPCEGSCLVPSVLRIELCRYLI
ncbi:hypothetical protein HPP92_020299 [Vanilla planifolia]|uniref:Uncharacterized protein n=1 Tax=Vanilla planifolia TaxID=51239 RepID=A0A835Q3E7_VANPL|nr:hypothetical protein HPP92_020700 [Vanilla planifolia]KAG0461823.1 hypothetical protein HPP92_020299 [Vanilla planifolia]